MSVSMPQYFNIPAFSKACIVFSGAIILAPLCAKKLTLLYTLGTLNCVALSALYDSNSTDNGLFTELTSSTIGPSLSAVLFYAQLTPLCSYRFRLLPIESISIKTSPELPPGFVLLIYPIHAPSPFEYTYAIITPPYFALSLLCQSLCRYFVLPFRTCYRPLIHNLLHTKTISGIRYLSSLIHLLIQSSKRFQVLTKPHWLRLLLIR